MWRNTPQTLTMSQVNSTLLRISSLGPHRQSLLLASHDSQRKGTPGSLAASQVAGGTAGALHQQVAVVTTANCVDLEQLAAAQVDCPSIVQLRDNQALMAQSTPIGQQLLWSDISTGQKWPMVPPSWQRKVFLAVHSLTHPGIRATRWLLSTRFVSRGMSADVGHWCRECADCQKAEITTQHTAPIQPISVPDCSFTHLHLDLVGPLTASSDGHTHVMTMIDRSTRWVEVVPLTSTTATACADALVSGWISRFSVPAALTTDRGVQFTSAVWAVLCSKLGISHVTTTTYHLHPQSNRIVERFHRQLTDAFRARLASTSSMDPARLEGRPERGPQRFSG